MRALQRLHIPTLLFVNKLDRPGADAERVLRDISERLTTAAVPIGARGALAGRGARGTGRRDHGGVRRGRDARAVPPAAGRRWPPRRRRRSCIRCFFGSAVTGDGLESLRTGITSLLPAAAGDPGGQVSATVFKIERGANGEKIAYVRMFSGTIHVRERLQFGRGLDDKVTAITVFEHGARCAAPGGLGRRRRKALGARRRSRSATGSASLAAAGSRASLSPRRRWSRLSPPSGPTTVRNSASRSRSSPNRIR